ncbi:MULTISPECIES: PD-(D/E)XK motif protein [unclassified Microbacterium]|uniref:PD-(D/E)XK motif protein n=1 Tax=unclassified Microbacterium TaxID=2609290 RepID=UPI0021A50BF4|nr:MULTISPECIES: PD-(D/E)XK motif protein [unclassified Microbacterium]MCT1363583.1 PD-(D/E)XK motif protein [Microbacterium sp. p3-SID131]MCT1375544.1 PD-(D/E)XK motif protein [Microbacterium sp. p3-SID337]
MASYEDALQVIAGTPRALISDVRDVNWLTDENVVGVARDTNGRVEMFLRGPRLQPSTSVVRDALEFRVVHRDNHSSFDANRLLLPAFGHFDQVAAFICTELLRNGADASLALAFRLTEPLIELAIERLRLSRQAIVGLAGELLLIDALCRRASGAHVSDVIAGWNGWRRSSRDLTFGSTGIEVKTTTGPASSHLVEGVHQVETDTSFGAEDRLILVSIGLQPSPDNGNAFTIPQLVDRTLAHMEAAGLSERAIQEFLHHLSEYGEGPGYDHLSQESDPAYSTGFLISFFRGYDMTDDLVQVLRRHDVAERVHVDVGSVNYRVDLPATLSASNPVAGANQVADWIFR